jgi:hypothetical protein
MATQVMGICSSLWTSHFDVVRLLQPYRYVPGTCPNAGAMRKHTRTEYMHNVTDGEDE